MNVKKEFNAFSLLIIIALCFGVLFVYLLVDFFKPVEIYNPELKEKQSQLVVRSIGDALLHSLGNDYEPLLPVKKVDSATYRLAFTSPLIIKPDTLVKIALKHINTSLSNQSIIHVLDAKTQEIVYGFEINHFTEHKIPCLGRVLPKSDYLVDVSFYKTHKVSSRSVVYSAFIIFILFLVIIAVFLFLKRNKLNDLDNVNTIKGMRIISNLNQIAFNNNIVQLTEKEMQIFEILFREEGKLVTREYLTNEVWFKKGVITARSLDMYISRLRKKMKKISGSKIINHHGKGYVLEI